MPIKFPVPDLPPFDPDRAITLREACNLEHVKGKKGKRLNAKLLRSWCTKGLAIVPGGPVYVFPSVKEGKERRTTPEWCAAWNRLVSRLRSAEALRQVQLWERCRAAART